VVLVRFDYAAEVHISSSVGDVKAVAHAQTEYSDAVF
jgi:hypothetical protein